MFFRVFSSLRGTEFNHLQLRHRPVRFGPVVYESLSLRVARHPSESEEYLVDAGLAYALEYTEGIEFSHGCAIRTIRRSRFAT